MSEKMEFNYEILKVVAKIPTENANLNAIIILDVFAKFIPITISKSLERLKSLYADWFKGKRGTRDLKNLKKKF
mgnify:CR=1 FL=1